MGAFARSEGRGEAPPPARHAALPLEAGQRRAHRDRAPERRAPDGGELRERRGLPGRRCGLDPGLRGGRPAARRVLLPVRAGGGLRLPAPAALGGPGLQPADRDARAGQPARAAGDPAGALRLPGRQRSLLPPASRAHRHPPADRPRRAAHGLRGGRAGPLRAHLRDHRPERERSRARRARLAGPGASAGGRLVAGAASVGQPGLGPRRAARAGLPGRRRRARALGLGERRRLPLRERGAARAHERVGERRRDPPVHHLPHLRHGGRRPPARHRASRRVACRERHRRDAAARLRLRREGRRPGPRERAPPGPACPA